jgi:hypothetical protein
VGDQGAELCDIRIVSATSLFVPGLPTPQAGTTAFSPGGADRVNVEDPESLARVFGFRAAKGAQQQKDGLELEKTGAAASVELEMDPSGTAQPGEISERPH